MDEVLPQANANARCHRQFVVGVTDEPKREVIVRFLRATAVPAGTAEARISYGNSVRLSVCLSVCHDPVVYQAQVR